MNESMKNNGEGRKKPSAVVSDALETFEKENLGESVEGEENRSEERGRAVRNLSRDRTTVGSGDRTRQGDFDEEINDLMGLEGDFSELEPVRFVLRTKTPGERAKENEDRMTRKLLVALVTGDTRKLLESDYDLGDLEDRALEAMRAGKLGSNGTSMAMDVISDVVRPVDKKDPGKIYDELSKNEAATERLYNITRGWKEKDDPEKTFSSEEQREIGADAIVEMIEEYPTALHYLNEVRLEVKRRREEEPEGLKAWEKSAMDLGRAIYGKQFEYAVVYDKRILGHGSKKEKRAEVGARAEAKPGALGAQVERKAEGPAERPEDLGAQVEGRAKPSAEQPGDLGAQVSGGDSKEVGARVTERTVKRGREKYGDRRRRAQDKITSAEERIEGSAEQPRGLGVQVDDEDSEKLGERVRMVEGPDRKVLGVEGDVIGVGPVMNVNPDIAQGTADLLAVQDMFARREQEKQEWEASKRRFEKKQALDDAKKAEETAIAERQRQEVLAERAKVKEKFKIEKKPTVKNPLEVFEAFKKCHWTKISGFLNKTPEQDSGLESISESGEVIRHECTLDDYEQLGLVPQVVIRADVGGKTISAPFSLPFRITRSDKGAAILHWRVRELTRREAAKSGGKKTVLYPEVYYKADLESGERWFRVKKFVQAAGSEAVDYSSMEEEKDSYLEEASEAMSGILDEAAKSDLTPEIDRMVGDRVVASSSIRETTLQRDPLARGGFKIVKLKDPYDEFDDDDK